jgi:hypothetical protein
MAFTTGPFAAQAQRILDHEEQFTRKNTRLAYDRKGQEFLAFCNEMYASHDFPATVTEEKVFGFLYYQAYRPSRKRGRKRRNAEDAIFDADHFRSVMEYDNYHEKPVAYDIVNQYLCSVLKIWKKQVDMNANNLTKDQIRSERVQRLLATVKTRKVTVHRMNFEEKLQSEFLPYLLVEKVPLIEKELFGRHAFSRKFCQGALRDRFCFLMTNGGILRGESLFNCELSDLCDLMKPDDGPHLCHILVMRIAIGKTNGLKTLYGRVMRHKDVTLCAVGALAFYLLARFHISGEVLDFSSNDSWFGVKLLIESSTADNTVSVNNQTYAKAMRSTCKMLGVVSKHFVHFGRSVGAVKAELEEMDSSLIKNLGNWNPDTQDDRYSAKLPLQALRIMAGHDRKKGMYYLPRSGVKPPEELSRSVFPFVDAELERNVGRHPTAMAFLTMLMRMRSVILQDVAMMKLLGRDHFLFSLPLFNSPLFAEFCDSLKAYLSTTARPFEASIESVLPGVQDKIDQVHKDIGGHLSVLSEKLESATDRLGQTVTTSQLQGFIHHIGQFELRHGSLSVTPTSLVPVPESTDQTDYVPFRGHRSVRSIWNEWNGIGEFSPDCNASCVAGGIKQLEVHTKGKWRVGWSSADQKYFSRIKFLVAHTESLISATFQERDALDLMDQYFEQKKNICALEKFLKAQNRG